MDDNLLPDDTERGSLEIKIEDRAKTNEFNEIIIPIKNKKQKAYYNFNNNYYDNNF